MRVAYRGFFMFRELNFKFYRQATNKIIGISNEAAVFPGRFFSHRSAAYLQLILVLPLELG
jgi:hypothetical protein